MIQQRRELTTSSDCDVLSAKVKMLDFPEGSHAALNTQKPRHRFPNISPQLCKARRLAIKIKCRK